MKTEVSVTFGFTWAILFLFFVFWAQNGWHRVDCALGQQPACALIAAEYK